MKVDVKRTVKKEVEIVETMTLKAYWVVRVIKDTGKLKECIFEKAFDNEPGGQEIASVLVNYLGKPVFVSVNKNYVLVKEEGAEG